MMKAGAHHDHRNMVILIEPFCFRGGTSGSSSCRGFKGGFRV